MPELANNGNVNEYIASKIEQTTKAEEAKMTAAAEKYKAEKYKAQAQEAAELEDKSAATDGSAEEKAAAAMSAEEKAAALAAMPAEEKAAALAASARAERDASNAPLTAQQLHHQMLPDLKASACFAFQMGSMQVFLTDTQTACPGNCPKLPLTH